MIFSDLKINCLRNLPSLHIALNPRFNLIIGANGSGKTAILEACYILSSGHSFRTREITPVISQQESSLTIFARTINHDTVSIKKSPYVSPHIKLNNRNITTTSQLAFHFPCQVFYSDIFHIIDAGPSVRRSILDWGLFHVKHNYLLVWKEFKKILKQRNALLKTRAPYSHFVPWDNQLNNLANELNIMRQEYFLKWQESFNKLLPLLTNVNCCLQYYKGWDRKNTGISLKELLVNNFEQDLQYSYTQYGPHQADIIIDSLGYSVKKFLSRGQQKIILFALKLSQADLLERDCLFLIDDFSAELDDFHQKNIINYLISCKGQFIITNLNFSEIFNIIPNANIKILEMHATV